jgi:hypothetical protein
MTNLPCRNSAFAFLGRQAAGATNTGLGTLYKGKHGEPLRRLSMIASNPTDVWTP